MSVLAVMTVPGDTATFEEFVSATSSFVLGLTEKSKAGDGEIVVVDEWNTAEDFQAFISSPEIQNVMGQMGARGEPRITFADGKGFPGSSDPAPADPLPAHAG
jgi:hypothetical protein